jgi:hypothetical protein
MLILYDINDVKEQAEKFQKEKLNTFFKKLLPVNPNNPNRIDLRFLYKTTISEDDLKLIVNRIRGLAPTSPAEVFALLGPPGCGKV